MKPSRRPAPAFRISPEILDRAPHLGLLDVVDHALRVAAWALYAEFPGLLGDPHPFRPELPQQVAARRLLRQMASFALALARYRRSLAPLLKLPPTLPFNDDTDF